MRLNFSGSDEESIREGIRRIGEVVREQVDLYGTLTGAAPAGGSAQPAEPAAGPDLADVLHLPPRTARDRRSDARGAASPCSRAAGRSSARCRCAPARGSRTRSSASATT
jgi:hypothetical protein